MTEKSGVLTTWDFFETPRETNATLREPFPQVAAKIVIVRGEGLELEVAVSGEDESCHDHRPPAPLGARLPLLHISVGDEPGAVQIDLQGMNPLFSSKWGISGKPDAFEICTTVDRIEWMHPECLSQEPSRIIESVVGIPRSISPQLMWPGGTKRTTTTTFCLSRESEVLPQSLGRSGPSSRSTRSDHLAIARNGGGTTHRLRAREGRFERRFHRVRRIRGGRP